MERWVEGCRGGYKDGEMSVLDFAGCLAGTNSNNDNTNSTAGAHKHGATLSTHTPEHLGGCGGEF